MEEVSPDLRYSVQVTWDDGCGGALNPWYTSVIIQRQRWWIFGEREHVLDVGYGVDVSPEWMDNGRLRLSYRVPDQTEAYKTESWRDLRIEHVDPPADKLDLDAIPMLGPQH